MIYKKSGTFDSKTICDGFLKRFLTFLISQNSFIIKTNYNFRVLIPNILSGNKENDNAHLILDQAPCHKTKEVKDLASTVGCSLIFIPPRMTGILQPPDVSWFAPIRKQYRKKWQNWFINDPKTFTNAGLIFGYIFKVNFK